ncbi:MAG: penicillin-binding protein 2 [Candidatus Pacebacteria bacterium]|nr:penicillin-binding protein 2 [Candidatus Paceibacterota bacterium]
MNTSFRLKLVLFGFWLLFGLVIGRLFYWQVLEADQLAIAALKQHQDLKTIPASRGRILAADKSSLAANEEVFLLFADPSRLEMKADLAAEKLAFLLAGEEEEAELEETIKNRLNQPDSLWVPLRRQVSREVKKTIEELEIAGLGFERDQKRIYPEGTASAHLLGFVGHDHQGEPKGYFGLEGFYDLQLAGQPGVVRREKDASGKPILLGFSYKEEKKDGRDLLTTLDRTVQFLVERKLKEALINYGAVSGSVVVMDPDSGAILGMVSLPAYDPVTYFNFAEEDFPNPVIASSFEPGSVFKILVAASAVNEGVITSETRCLTCSGPRKIGGFEIHTWNDRYYPNSTVAEILIHSDNVGMIFVAEKLGRESFLKYLKGFGFAEPTGIDLQEEDVSPLRPAEEWKEIDLATASFGQGIAVTPLQMIRAAAVIANRGWLIDPHVVSGIIEAGEVKEIKNRLPKRVLKSSAAESVSAMMVEAVEKGEAKWAKPEGFRIAGKTGTAQIPVEGHYDKEKTIASFVGFAPAGRPRFVMLVTLKEPSSSPWGSETAAPLWFEIARELFIYWGVMPER